MIEPRSPAVRVGILGAGYISKYHLEGLKTVGKARVVALCDLNRGRGEVVAKMFGVPKVFADLAAMLDVERPDVVHVLLPPAAHADAVVRVLESGAHVFVEKPICLDEDGLSRIRAAATQMHRHVGVGHNFLFADAYQRLATDVRSGRLGRISRIDVIWDQEQGLLRSGPFDAWLFAQPTNILFEVGPHVFAYVAHLAGTARDLLVRADDWVTLPGGRLFAKRWEVLATAGTASVRLRLGFASGYPEHFIAVRGTTGVAIADVNGNTYALNEHTTQMLDLDRFLVSTRAASAVIAQSAATLGHFMRAKMGLQKVGSPYGRSIAACLRAFYDGLDRDRLDDRVADGVAGRAVEIAILVSRAVSLPEPAVEAPLPSPPAAPAPSVLVVGGTGFIGRALVRKLREAGHGVRLLARHPGSVPREILGLGVQVVRGDFTDTASVAAALDGIQHVYHLARGDGSTWPEYLATDVEPTRQFAELCAESGVQGFHYTSSTAIYYAGRGAATITEKTPPHAGIARSNLYVRSKVENERNLLQLHRTRGLRLVIYRPAIVIGRGGNLMPPGVASWPYPWLSRLWGDGHNALPVVLVDDCADAMVRGLGRVDIHGLSFNLVGEPCLTARDYLDSLERSTGLKVRRVPTSSLRYFAEEVAKYAIKTLGRDPNCRRPSYAEWAGRAYRARFDTSRAKQILGWEPASSLEVIVREGIDIPAREYFA
jgi:predicted dehydrogenase/nucleoside-diphosphate-sugar epimerase